MAKKRSSPATQLARAPRGYTDFLGQLKQRIRTSRLRATVTVNRELIGLYWSIGRDILARQRKQGWGAKVIDRLSADLRRAFLRSARLSWSSLRLARFVAASLVGATLVGEVPGLATASVRTIDSELAAQLERLRDA